jgi:hypothetical protein
VLFYYLEKILDLFPADCYFEVYRKETEKEGEQRFVFSSGVEVVTCTDLKISLIGNLSA